MAALTSAQRRRLPDSAFAFIQNGKRRFPINDKKHAELAIQMLPLGKNMPRGAAAKVRRKALKKLGRSGQSNSSPASRRPKRNPRVASMMRSMASQRGNSNSSY